MNQLRIYLISLAIFLLIDMVWLGFIAKDLYRKHLGYLMGTKPNWTAAIIFYLLFIAGLVFFVVDPALKNESWKYALFAGMFFGLVTYSTYDLTNMATVRDWPLKITLIDLTWGTSLSGAVSIVSYYINRLIG